LKQTSKIKLQTSNKLQLTKFKLWFLVFDYHLIFGVWCLNFERPEEAL